MRTLRCKCGEAIMWTTDGVHDCQGCKICGTTYAGHPDHHKELQPHKWKPMYHDKTGKPYKMCELCYHIDEKTHTLAKKGERHKEVEDVDKFYEDLEKQEIYKDKTIEGAKTYGSPAVLSTEPSEEVKLNDPPIPKDLDEAIETLATEHNIEFVIRCTEDSFLGGSHHGFGTGIRNTWGLWSGSVLAKWFNERGIYHADDMSGIILTSFYRKAHQVDIDLEGQIKHYRDYWDKTAPDVNNGII